MKVKAPSSRFDIFSHDLNSSLTNIQANVGLIRIKLSPEEKEKIEKHLEKIETEIQELNRTLSALRDEIQKITP